MKMQISIENHSGLMTFIIESIKTKQYLICAINDTDLLLLKYFIWMKHTHDFKIGPLEMGKIGETELKME